MNINSRLFEAHLHCATKCWLRSRAEPGGDNEYADWIHTRERAYDETALRHLLPIFPESHRAVAPPIHPAPKDLAWRYAIDVRLRSNDLDSRLQALESIPPKSRLGVVQFIPYRFEFANKLTKEHKLLLAFDAFLLTQAVKCKVNVGKIVYGDAYAVIKVQLSKLTSEVRKHIKAISTLLNRHSPPDLVLNRHCGQCEFQTKCRHLALEKDDLSLLSRMTKKERYKLNAKGIFTIRQLSYTFRPRRRRRETTNKLEKYNHSLRALAIRENKIHVVSSRKPNLTDTPVYLNVEGLPDRDFYYLIGVRVKTGDGAIHHSFWADDAAGERRIWNEFIDVLSRLPSPRVVHFGSYEKLFMKRMYDRYGEPSNGISMLRVIDEAVNLVSYIFGQVYFPTFSSRLKDIARYLGFQWSGSLASGLGAVIARHRWEASKDAEAKYALLTYNRQDCEALELVANSVVALSQNASLGERPLQNDVVYPSDIKWQSPYGFKRIDFVFPEMELINNAAYWDYQRDRVFIKSQRKPNRGKIKKHSYTRALAPNSTIECARPPTCVRCGSSRIERHGRSTRIVIDLRFMKHGIKRWITKYIRYRYRCKSCSKTFFPDLTAQTVGKYGFNLVAYTMYLNIGLGLPQIRVDACLRKSFGLNLPIGATAYFKRAVARSYQGLYDDLLTTLCTGSLLHIDETSISVKGKSGYVWVLANMDQVAYFYTPTREGAPIQSKLRNFSGVLVSDFYAVYDSINCPQQKCLIHFIRDLNDALLKSPYDEQLRELARAFVELVKPIIDTVDRRGLKKRFLAKHRVFVERFYKKIVARDGMSQGMSKLVERLIKNRNKMFTFLEFDEVPWNNNNAEHAVKAFATLRRVIGGSTTEGGLREYLIVLSLCETCKYGNIDFLDFLRSRSTNMDGFSWSRLRKSK
jgi:predicted RecB family nuclease